MFCVYVTFYSGDRLPQFYIGSSSVHRVQNGYHGTVKSKRYRDIWNDELRNNPLAFDTLIISTFETRQEATAEELRVQRLLNVVNDPHFINGAFATVNGFFTMEKSGMQNPMFGRRHTEATKDTISKKAALRDFTGSRNPMYGKPGPMGMLGKKHTDETRMKMKLKQQERIADNNHWHDICGEDHPAFGYKHSEEFKASQRIPKPKMTCPHCSKTGGKPAMVRFHFENCKSLLKS